MEVEDDVHGSQIIWKVGMDEVRPIEYIEIWVTSDGREIPVEKIENIHLIRILRQLSKRKEKDMSFISLCREARRRNLEWRG